MPINHYHQSVEEILKTATPEQKILWNEIFLRFGERVAVRQYFYIGNIPGSPFLTYVARQLFLAYEFDAGWTPGSNVNSAYITFYDELNNANGYGTTISAIWNGTTAAPNYVCSQYNRNNFYFSRILGTVYGTMKFNGFRLTY